MASQLAEKEFYMSKFSFAKKFNTGKLFNIDTKDFEYVSLEDLSSITMTEEGTEPQVFIVRGVYINDKSLYGTSPVIALDDTYVNLPSHLTAVCQEMIDDRLAVQAINECHLGFRIESYLKEKYNKICYTVEWVDL